MSQTLHIGPRYGTGLFGSIVIHEINLSLIWVQEFKFFLYIFILFYCILFEVED